MNRFSWHSCRDGCQLIRMPWKARTTNSYPWAAFWFRPIAASTIPCQCVQQHQLSVLERWVLFWVFEALQRVYKHQKSPVLSFWFSWVSSTTLASAAIHTWHRSTLPINCCSLAGLDLPFLDVCLTSSGEWARFFTLRRLNDFLLLQDVVSDCSTLRWLCSWPGASAINSSFTGSPYPIQTHHLPLRPETELSLRLLVLKELAWEVASSPANP